MNLRNNLFWKASYKYLFLIVVILLSVLINMQLVGAQSQGPKVDLASSFLQVKEGDSLDVVLSISNQSTPITIVELGINYDATKLEFKSSDFSSSSFGSELPTVPPAESGKVFLGRYNLSPITGNATIGKLSFGVIGNSGTAKVEIDATQSKMFSIDNPSTNIYSAGNSLINFNIVNPVVSNPPVGGQGEEVVVVIPNNPPPASSPPIKVSQGSVIKLQSPSLSGGGSKKQKTEYLMNGGTVGTSNNGEEVPVDTSTLSPGTYKVTTKSYLDDGTVEESSQNIEIVEEGLVSKYRLPIVMAGVTLITVCLAIVAKRRLADRLPKY